MTQFTVGHEDWSLHRKGLPDQQRHREKVRQAIREHLSDIISEESIIVSEEDRVVKIPVPAIREYRFRFDQGRQKQVGHGGDGLEIGDMVAGGCPPALSGKGAGTEPGSDYYEAEVTLDELSELMFEDLHLPNLRDKPRPQLVTESVDFRDVRKRGPAGNLDRRRTIKETFQRNALKGRPGLQKFTPEDLRYRTWNPVRRPESAAVVLAMMDTSGSMGPFEKHVARSFFFWMVRFLKTRYDNVEVVFLAHHTEARETTQDEFFSRGESGGTRCSSVYRLALDIVAERYSPRQYNVYAFHFSDGDNLASDNDLCVALAGQLVGVSNLVGYGEIEGPYYYTSTLRSAFKKIADPRFVTVVLRDKSEVYSALRTFFRAGPADEAGPDA
ncbi:MAG: sporulation protein YhbH [Bacillota bacterium]